MILGHYKYSSFSFGKRVNSYSLSLSRQNHHSPSCNYVHVNTVPAVIIEM
jgi:hypothetical protein